MTLERKNNVTVEIQELENFNLEHIASTLLSENIAESNTPTNYSITKLLKFLNLEYQLNEEQKGNYYLLWIMDKKIIGFVSVSDISSNEEAKVKFNLFDYITLSKKEIQESIVSSTEHIFKKFNLNRLVIHIDKNSENLQPEREMIKLYTSYPIGLIHLDQQLTDYVVVKENTNKKPFYIFS